MRLVKEEGVAQARLAELLEIEPISVSRLLDRMEEGGWIERRQDASDRRVRMIFPTDKSREAFAAIKSVAGEVYDEALAGLTAEEQRTPDQGPERDRRQSLRRRDAGRPTQTSTVKRQCSMNAVAKVKDDVTEVELDRLRPLRRRRPDAGCGTGRTPASAQRQAEAQPPHV